ncbi:MAG: HlyD family secretion protein, partial [Planctomycetes bacterium]|nr:HlyD family secretion protein [Planctomycetota bacterium]
MRKASPEELPFLFVNASRQLFPYRQAVYWDGDGRRLRMRSASGLAVIDAGSPYGQWMDRFAGVASRIFPAGEPVRFDLSSLPGITPRETNWLGDWREWLPAHGLWRRFDNRAGAVLGALALFREDAFTDAEVKLFTSLFGMYEQSLAALSPGRARGRPRLRRLLAVAALAAAAGAGFIPVRNSALAPAEVVAQRPEIVRSTLEGVVDRLWVEPNQTVAAGDLLLTLD